SSAAWARCNRTAGTGHGGRPRTRCHHRGSNRATATTSAATSSTVRVRRSREVSVMGAVSAESRTSCSPRGGGCGLPDTPSCRPRVIHRHVHRRVIFANGEGEIDEKKWKVSQPMNNQGKSDERCTDEDK